MASLYKCIQTFYYALNNSQGVIIINALNSTRNQVLK